MDYFASAVSSSSRFDTTKLICLIEFPSVTSEVGSAEQLSGLVACLPLRLASQIETNVKNGKPVQYYCTVSKL